MYLLMSNFAKYSQYKEAIGVPGALADGRRRDEKGRLGL
jgi:hypothetical protein